METTANKFQKTAKINWYRCKVDPKLMSELMQCSDYHGLKQALGHLGLWVVTGTLAYLAFLNVHKQNWYWAVPLLYAALFAHGSVGAFAGGTACHELSHKTPFKNKKLNDFFLKVFAFIGYWDHIWFRPSHIRHHQVTVHKDYDGEVALPAPMNLKNWKMWLGLFAWNPQGTWFVWKIWFKRAQGKMDGEWYEYCLPESNEKLRRDHQNWARFLLIGHAVLATIFIVTGHWFLIVLFTIGSHYCGWLQMLTGSPQHYGLTPDVPDHRLSCRTYTCAWLPRFLYWNMNYHVEHHMFPAVPFFNLPKLHEAIKDDLPPTPHGLRATWAEMIRIHRISKTDPKYCYLPPLPKSSAAGDRAEDDVLEREAALAV